MREAEHRDSGLGIRDSELPSLESLSTHELVPNPESPIPNPDVQLLSSYLHLRPLFEEAHGFYVVGFVAEGAVCGAEELTGELQER